VRYLRNHSSRRALCSCFEVKQYETIDFELNDVSEPVLIRLCVELVEDAEPVLRDDDLVLRLDDRLGFFDGDDVSEVILDVLEVILGVLVLFCTAFEKFLLIFVCAQVRSKFF